MQKDASETVLNFYEYTYDRNGNRLTKTVDSTVYIYLYNALDQLVEEKLDGNTERTYDWDEFGRLMRERNGSGAVVREYDWTVDDRLAKVTLDVHGDPKSIAYTYDHLGTRVSRNAPGDDGNVRHLVDYRNLSGYAQSLADLSHDGTSVFQNYVYGHGHGLLAQRGASPIFFHGDHLSTTRQLTDAGGDALLAAPQQYEPFGALLSDGPGSLTTHSNFAFTGQYRDIDTGLQYHRARWLDVYTGRWLSTDPVFDFPGNLGNAWTYIGARVLDRVDVSGTMSLGEKVGVAAVIGALVAINIDLYLNPEHMSAMRLVQVAALGAAMAVVVVLIFAAVVALFTALGLSTAEATLVATVLATPVNLGLAGKGMRDARTPNEKRLAVFLFWLSVFAAFGDLLVGIRGVTPGSTTPPASASVQATARTLRQQAKEALGFEPMDGPASSNPVQVLERDVVLYRYEQYRSTRRILPDGSVAESTFMTTAPPDVMGTGTNATRMLDPTTPQVLPDFPTLQRVYTIQLRAGDRVRVGTVPRGLYHPDRGGYTPEVINVAPLPAEGGKPRMQFLLDLPE